VTGPAHALRWASACFRRSTSREVGSRGGEHAPPGQVVVGREDRGFAARWVEFECAFGVLDGFVELFVRPSVSGEDSLGRRACLDLRPARFKERVESPAALRVVGAEHDRARDSS